MKKNYLPLLAISIALIAIGIALQMHSSASEKKESASSSRKADSTVNTTSDFGDLLSVSTPANTKSEIKDYEGFRVSFNKDNRTPNWVSWELLASETDGSSPRNNNFWQDTDLEGCPGTWDYTGSGYDRGHLCPAADQKWSDNAMNDCFVLANICPQDHALNSGAWSTLEKKERLWAKRDGKLIIIAGPIYTDSDSQRIGDAGVRVPSSFFKVIIAPDLNQPRGIGFVYPNMKAPGNMQLYSMTVDEVEKLTGYDFFYNLPDDIENKIESVTSFKEWIAGE